MREKVYTYFYEGETEKHFIECLKKNGAIRNGKLKKFNFWETKIQKILPTLGNKKNSVYFIVFDTDCLNNIDLFKANILTLAKHSLDVVLLAQHSNFEDELVYACEKTNRTKLLLDLYSVNSVSNFKRSIINETDLYRKICDNNFSVLRIWSRYDVYGTHLASLSDFSHRNDCQSLLNRQSNM